MLLSLDNLANRYGLLPSEALAKASTLDLEVLALSSMYHTRQQQIAENPALVEAEDLSNGTSQDDLQAMLDHSNKLQKDRANGNR